MVTATATSTHKQLQLRVVQPISLAVAFFLYIKLFGPNAYGSLLRSSMLFILVPEYNPPGFWPHAFHSCQNKDVQPRLLSTK